MRAKQLVDLAQARGVPASDAGLARVLDLVAKQQFGRVGAMFADSASSTRRHDVARQGMRAGGFASVHGLMPGREPQSPPSTTYRREPESIGYRRLFAEPGFLSEAQRDWIVMGHGNPPAACGIESLTTLEQFAQAFSHIGCVLYLRRSAGDAPDPMLVRLLRCGVDNLNARTTTETLTHAAASHDLAEVFTARRAVNTLQEDLKSFGKYLPELAGLPLTRWSESLADANVLSPLREGFEAARAAGRLDIAAAVSRSLQRYGDSGANPRLLSAASLIQDGAYEMAAHALSHVQPATLLGNLRMALESPEPRITTSMLDALERDGRAELARALRNRAVKTNETTLALRPARALAADALIAAGKRMLPPEAHAVIADVRRLYEEKRQESPISRITALQCSKADTELAGHMERLTESIMRERAQEGAGYDVIADSVVSTDAIRGVYADVPTALRDVLRWTSGRGIACFDTIDATGETSQFSKTRSLINLLNVQVAVKENVLPDARRDVFHEVGHAAEYADPGLGTACREFRHRRAMGRPPQPLDTLGPYRSTDPTLPGEFVNAYVGKLYADGTTEVMAVGLEHFKEPATMAHLCAHDPEHFFLVLGWLTS